MRKRVADLLGENAGRAIEVYRQANPNATPSDIYFLIASDYRYGAPTMKIAERRAALGKGPVYLVLLPLGNAGRRRPAQVAAHDGDSVRVRQRQGRRG